MKLLRIYLIVGFLVCGWYTIAAVRGWRAVNLGIVDNMNNGSGGGRAYGGSWGGGK
ncbi:hypothetical protein LOC71_21835 [Rhodopirellula sp. JC740]|uniref:Membrane or secreted protein n=1 Tax=Rhodopirellula halodulae TaxID=2894198 RepID=A0ABS8NMY6_9BACT|nr:hypothetical protein [Rhodopirellula sp. JC740]MCC9644926.1 hypothetical protein [Rhodopirellula sp. JC740]